MENPAWLFVTASAIAVVGTITAFKHMISNTLAASTAEERLNVIFRKEQVRFFIKVTLIEAIPLILVVFGFVLSENSGTFDILLPLIVVVGFLIFGVVTISLTRMQIFSDQHITDRLKQLVATSTFIGLAMVSAIPFVSIVFLLTMNT